MTTAADQVNDRRGGKWANRIDRTAESAAVAILTPAGRDGPVADQILRQAGFNPHVCASIADVCAEIADDVGVVVIAEEALAGPAGDALLSALEQQAAWSDVPILVLTGEGELSRGLSTPLGAVASRANVTLLERPIRVATLITTLRSALRARRRQFDLRDHLAQRTAAETALRAAREQADEANRAKGEFLAVMSHELRTPLNAIGGYAELIQLGVHGPVTDEQKNALNRIQRSQRHLLALITDLLNFTKLEAGQVEYEIRDVSLRSAIDELETLVAPQLASKSLEFSRTGCGDDCIARADPDRLQQVLVNLLSNAIKFTTEGGAVTVDCDTHGNDVRVQVRDTGIGIPRERLEHVFAPFVQIDRRLNAPNEGVGLGLAISRDLARAMGGDLTVESAPGRGSTFTLTLPIGKASGDSTAKPKS